jgi:Flp pilus assembly protein TadG
VRVKRNEEGASLVEFALLLPVLVLILFGIVDFGSLYNSYQSVRQGARDGMRQAVVAMPTNQTCTVQSGGTQITGDAQQLVCYVKARVGLGDNTRVRIIWNGPQTSAATDKTNFPAGNPVMVCVQYPAQSLSGILAPFLNGKVLNTQAETLIEQDNNTLPLTTAAGVYPAYGDVYEPGLGNSAVNNGWPTSCDHTKL